MFFVFSKLLVFFIYPLSWILFFLAAALVIKNPKLKRRFLIIAAVLLLVFSDPFLFNQFAKRWDIAPVLLKNTGPYSCVIILGGFTSEGAKGEGFFNANADRFIQGVKLFTAGKVSHILISSGNGNLIRNSLNEANWAKTQLQQLKVPDSSILIENRSRNTIENAAFSKTVLKNNHLQPPYLLITSAFHMRRSLGIFKKTGIDVTPYPCSYITKKGSISIDDLIPDAPTLGGWNTYIKELVGTAVNFLR